MDHSVWVQIGLALGCGMLGLTRFDSSTVSNGAILVPVG